MNNEEHTSILRDDVIHAKEFKISCIIPIVQRPCPILNLETITENSIGREPNLDFSSAAEILSKD